MSPVINQFTNPHSKVEEKSFVSGFVKLTTKMFPRTSLVRNAIMGFPVKMVQ